MIPPKPNLNSTVILTTQKINDVVNSSKYRGLVKYMSRVLRPVWNFSIINKEKSKSQIESRLTCIDLGRVLNSINYLKNWMENNKIGTNPLSTQTSVDVSSFEAAQFNSLYKLLVRAQEQFIFELAIVGHISTLHLTYSLIFKCH